MVLKKTPHRTDEEIEADLTANLRWDDRVESTRIEAEVEDGQVVLKGSIPTYTARAAAMEQARLTPGVTGVADQMTVEVKANVPGLEDDALAARANDILQWDSALEGDDVRAMARDGALELEGSVSAHWKSRRASTLVMGIRGVQDVRNNLAVVPTHEVADEALGEQIVAALRRNVLVNEDRIQVSVDRGIVTLSGSVPSWMEANTVREVASNTPGTLEIRDRLKTDREAAPA